MKRVLIGALLLTISGLANAADDSGFEFGLAVGRASLDDRIFGLPVDSDSTAWKVVGGYRINKHFAAELAYLHDLGAEETIQGVNIDIDNKALQASVVGTIPLGDTFSFYGRVGMLAWDSEATAVGPGGSVTVEDDGTDPSYGIGFSAWLDGALIRLEHERAEIEQTDVKLLSLSIVWMF